MITARLAVELPDGLKEQYFIKCASEESGCTMMEGEFNGMSELHKTMPNRLASKSVSVTAGSMQWSRCSKFKDQGVLENTKLKERKRDKEGRR
jgi:hypothetical protein